MPRPLRTAMRITTMPMAIMATIIMLTTIVRMITTMTTTTGMAITSITTVIPMLITTTSAPSDGCALMGADAAALYRLMTWLSPAFPVGGFSYSSGIEWAVEAGDIGNAET